MLHSAALKGCLRSLNVQFSDVRNFASMELKTVVRKLEEFAPTSLGNLFFAQCSFCLSLLDPFKENISGSAIVK